MRLLPLPGVFQPISDSWMLASCVQRERVGPGASVLDLCTGSGMLAVKAALLGASATAVDVSRRSMLSVRLNARLNGVAIETLRGDLFRPVQRRRFDLIVSNPPYVPSQVDGRPGYPLPRAWAAGPSGRRFIDPICAEVAQHLNPGGVLLMVQGAVCDAERTMEMLSQHGLEPGVAMRHRGPLGPRMRAQAQWLRDQGRLPPGEEDEIIIVRAVAGHPRSRHTGVSDAEVHRGIGRPQPRGRDRGSLPRAGLAGGRSGPERRHAREGPRSGRAGSEG